MAPSWVCSQHRCIHNALQAPSWLATYGWSVLFCDAVGVGCQGSAVPRRYHMQGCACSGSKSRVSVRCSTEGASSRPCIGVAPPINFTMAHGDLAFQIDTCTGRANPYVMLHAPAFSPAAHITPHSTVCGADNCVHGLQRHAASRFQARSGGSAAAVHALAVGNDCAFHAVFVVHQDALP